METPIIAKDTYKLNLSPVAVLTDGHYLLQKTSNVNEISNQQTTINIERSNNVLIGNVNEFHGPVTILPNAQKSQQLCHSDSVSSDKLDEQYATKICHKKHWLLIVPSCFAIIALITIALYFTLNQRDDSNNDSVLIEPKELLNPAFRVIGNHKVFERNVWGGRKPKSRRILTHPTQYVMVSHTAGAFCTTPTKCSEIMQDIQNLHVTKYDSPDIGYNFLIGGDANIYVGRGWDSINFHQEGCIGISFIGNFIYDKPTIGMLNATKMLLEEGVEQHKLPKNYHLVAHNQTYATLSPGVNIYREIKTWPNFLPGDSISWED